MTKKEALELLTIDIHCEDKGDEKDLREAIDMARNALKNAEEIEQSLKEIREHIKKECKNDEKEVVPPFTIADLTIKVSCRDKEIIEDVIFYLRAYLRREYGEDDITECLDREIANARQQSLNKLNTYESKDCKYNERQQL